ncbi:MAG: dienelactone hydrolase family protein [Candidatus Binatia bacterium]
MGEHVTFPSNGRTTAGFLATPKSGKGAGVIVIQEWWGLVPHIRQLCERLAGEGFVALAPDLYHGEQTTSPDEAERLMMALNIAETERDLAGAAEFLASRAASSKLGVVGFCMGGQLALFAACTNRAIGACVDFYGIHPAVRPDLGRLSAPVLGFFGGRDEFVTPEAARSLESEIRAAGKPVELHVYPDAGHAFFNDSNPEAHVEARAKEAWGKMLAFFRRHLA